jgi:hypothetical protein
MACFSACPASVGSRRTVASSCASSSSSSLIAPES